ncbi:MAG: hypothetical protein K6G26_07035 [Lachnospiraceae bacterium]|nr:hypothetical protein [Lachnospiraceae bacterium]
MRSLKKLFGGIDLTWKKVIIASIIAGVYTAIMAIVPALQYTSFNTIAVTFEVWILLGIIIIMNSKSNKDAALKCFVFFLISQPLVYLIQVPFSWQHWGLFGYYKFWFIWTILCLPMGYIGYYMKKNKWWGLLILLPMISLTLEQYAAYLSYFIFSYPRYILISIFCAAAAIIYPIAIFDNKKIRIAGVSISALLIIIITVFRLVNPFVYSTDLLLSGEEYTFDDTYKVYFDDEKYGDLSIKYEDGLECWKVHAEIKRDGKTTFTLESPEGEKREFSVDIKRDTYDLEEIK